MDELLHAIRDLVVDYEDATDNETIVGVLITIADRSYEFDGEKFVELVDVVPALVEKNCLK